MIESYEFLKSVLDTITEHVVVIDKQGNILFINKSWRSFGENNACLINESWHGVNYLQECDKAGEMGDALGIEAARGIRTVINGDNDKFYFEYPCHSPDEERWFMMRVTPFVTHDTKCYVISHQNITERKIAENVVLNLSRIDGLTNIANRRYFDEFLKDEWQRCNRLGMPLSLALVDLDYFKLVNNTYGHQVGDECLRAVGKVLKEFGKRPSDMCARYGGEEFVVVFGNTSLEQAKILTNKLLNNIRLLKIPNENSPILPTLTASIGLATMYPSHGNNGADLIKLSDKALYVAKEQGRNKIHIG